jgi:alkanesulfonate monooxygenase SsuD/methylene tetrahydromethanopterin reductase-like flavin-dependent oxidoreductase (luciferase family)
VLSGGRVELGMGAGWNEAEHHQAGLPWDTADVRIERLAESVNIIKRLLADESVEHHGRHYDLDRLSVYPKTPQGASLPFVLGGGGRKMLGLAARVADIISITTNNNGRTAAGDRFDDIELNARIKPASA